MQIVIRNVVLAFVYFMKLGVENNVSTFSYVVNMNFEVDHIDLTFFNVIIFSCFFSFFFFFFFLKENQVCIAQIGRYASHKSQI